MLDGLRRLLTDFAGLGEDEGAHLHAIDHQIAASALLVHLLNVDGVVEDEERDALRGILMRRFDLDEAGAEELIAEGRQRDSEAVDLYGFTTVLKRSLDAEGRAGVVEMMWELVFSDGAVNELEDNVVWRAAELLGVGTRERVELKRRVAARARPVSDASSA